MNIPPFSLLVISLCGYAFGAVGALIFMRREKLANFFSFGMASLSALSGLLAALTFLSAGPGWTVTKSELLPSFIPYIQFTVRLDPLGAFFVLLVSLLGLAISIYSLGYARGFYGRKNVGVLGAFFNLLLLATTLVFVAGNAFFFLIAWEIMALTAYCLVSFEHEKVETRNAGVLFF
ncbi:MAG TPA: hydrogenase 4 subunit B, partial [Candidatus Paceibacterota bacterium]|nr:hydrogenase 4 subunit B [Candidatus Paceibacterota bacterium]